MYCIEGGVSTYLAGFFTRQLFFLIIFLDFISLKKSPHHSCYLGITYLVTLYMICNRFQTHKRFKRFEVYKSNALVLLFWKQNMTLSQSDRFPPWGENNLIGQSDYFPSREGKRSDWFFVVTWSVRNGIANSHWFLTIEWTLKFEWILTDEGHQLRIT